MELGAVGATTAMSAFAWVGAVATARPTRSRSINDGKFSSTDMVRLAFSVGRGSERSAEFGTVILLFHPPRAREELGGAMPTDLLDLLGPPGRYAAAAGPHTMVRSPAAHRHSLFSGLVFTPNSGADDGARAVGATDDDDVGFATYGVDRSTMANSQALTWCAWLRSRRARL